MLNGRSKVDFLTYDRLRRCNFTVQFEEDVDMKQSLSAFLFKGHNNSPALIFVKREDGAARKAGGFSCMMTDCLLERLY